jgi:hypothetical protein
MTIVLRWHGQSKGGPFTNIQSALRDVLMITDTVSLFLCTVTVQVSSSPVVESLVATPRFET